MASTDPHSTPIRITADENAPAYRIEDPNKTHPYRGKELLEAINQECGTHLNAFDLTAIKKHMDFESHPEYRYVPLGGSSQYSKVLPDHLVSEFKSNASYFDGVRHEYSQRQMLERQAKKKVLVHKNGRK